MKDVAENFQKIRQHTVEENEAVEQVQLYPVGQSSIGIQVPPAESEDGRSEKGEVGF